MNGEFMHRNACNVQNVSVMLVMVILAMIFLQDRIMEELEVHL